MASLPASFQVLPMRGELEITVFSFIQSGPFGVLISGSIFSLSPSLHFMILGVFGFLIGCRGIDIDILIVWFQLGFDICSGKLMHLTTVPVCVTAA